MTRNTVTMPLARLRYPTFVEYGGHVYRAWKPMPTAAPLHGIVLVATDTAGEQHALIYANPAATAQVVTG